MSEKTILNKLQIFATSVGARLFRNNNGLAWSGQAVNLPDGSILIKNPRPIKYGLGVGSGDLFGGTQVKIEPHHVGRTFFVVTNLEVKTKTTRTTKEQTDFHNAIIKLGGISVIDRYKSPNDELGKNYVESVNQFRAASS